MNNKETIKHNGLFALIRDAYENEKHPNQQGGTDFCVDVLDFGTGQLNTVRLYENTKGLHFKKYGTHYLSNFNMECLVTPYRVTTTDGKDLSGDWGLINAIGIQNTRLSFARKLQQFLRENVDAKEGEYINPYLLQAIAKGLDSCCGIEDDWLYGEIVGMSER